MLQSILGFFIPKKKM